METTEGGKSSTHGLFLDSSRRPRPSPAAGSLVLELGSWDGDERNGYMYWRGSHLFREHILSSSGGGVPDRGGLIGSIERAQF
jgi:hypothetical protein